MRSMQQGATLSGVAPEQPSSLPRRAATGGSADVLSEIFLDDVNIAIWRRSFSEDCAQDIRRFSNTNPHFESEFMVAPSNARARIERHLGETASAPLVESMVELVELFCRLLELEESRLRFSTLTQAMCPRFHVDIVPCRLITTYQGVGTDWLPQAVVDRSKLGSRSGNLSDAEAGLYQNEHDIQQLGCGDVALLKGERWPGNTHGGLVHRSPDVPTGTNRLLLTLDVGNLRAC